MANILITGGTGYIGSALCKQLLKKGHSVAVLTRGKSELKNGIDYIHFSDYKLDYTNQTLLSTNVLIHLSGLSINTGFRWTKSIKQELFDSRIKPLQALKQFFETNKMSPHIISAGGITHYTDGHSGYFDETDDTEQSSNFLAELCRQWEAAALDLENIGSKVGIIRTSVVLEKDNLVTNKLRKVAKIPFLALPFKGQQAFPWVSLKDLIRIYAFILEQNLSGTYNAVAPANNTLKDLLEHLKGSKKWILPLPRIIIKWILGDKSVLFLQGAFIKAKALDKENFDFKVKNLSDL